MPSTHSNECPIYGRCLNIAITNIRCFSSHLVPSAFTSIKALRERERERELLTLKKSFSLPKTKYDLREGWGLVLGQMISLVILGENQPRDEVRGLWFILFLITQK